MTGIIVGLIVVAIASFSFELQIHTKKKRIEALEKDVKFFEDQLRKLMKIGSDLSTDYLIILDILIDEIGIDEADKRFVNRKDLNESIDLNDFLKDFKKGV